MVKLFIWIVVIVAVLMVARVLSYSKAKRNNSPPTQRPLNHRFQKGEPEPMVRCAHCGIYLPRSQALMSNHHTWCSLEHAKHGPRK